MPSKNQNWGQYLVDYNQNNLKKHSVVKGNYFNCPLRNYIQDEQKKRKNDYWWADLSNKSYFPDGTLNERVDPKTPIIGDDPENHRDLEKYPLHILLKNGNVIEVKKGEKIYRKAYGKNGALKPPGE